MKKALYLRKSRQGEELDALATHRSVLVKMCNQKGWAYDIYEEITSGESDKHELNKLLDNITNYDAIVCMDVDRLSRNKVESFQIQALLTVHNVKVITPSGEYNFADESADMMYSIKSIFASAELKKTKARMKNGKINRFEKGEYSIGKPPFGFRIGDDKRLVINEEQAEIVRKVFELCINGMGMVNIGDAVGLHRSNIKNMLNHRAYIGEIRFDIYDKMTGDVTETLFQSCPQIIDVETFVNAQEQIKRRDRHPLRTRSKGNVKTFLQGLVRCSVCGNQLVFASTRSGKILKCHTRHCPTSGMKVEFIEGLILHEFETATDVLNRVLEERLSLSAPSTLGDEIKSLQDHIEGYQTKVGRIKEAFFDGMIDKAEFQERKSSIDKEISDLTLKVRALELQQKRDDNRAHVEEVLTLLRDLEHFESKGLIDQHQIMTRLVDKINYTRTIPAGVNLKKVHETHPPRLEIVWREF